MDKETRNAIERATQRARKLLDEDFSSQLEGTFDVLRSGIVAKGGAHLSANQAFQRDKIVAAIEHKRAAGMTGVEAVTDYVRDAAFTTFNRFVALKMLEARELVQECITKGEQSAGYREFCGMAPGLSLLPDGAGYRLFVESLFDELSTGSNQPAKPQAREQADRDELHPKQRPVAQRELRAVRVQPGREHVVVVPEPQERVGDQQDGAAVEERPPAAEPIGRLVNRARSSRTSFGIHVGLWLLCRMRHAFYSFSR